MLSCKVAKLLEEGLKFVKLQSGETFRVVSEILKSCKVAKLLDRVCGFEKLQGWETFRMLSEIW